MTTNLTTMRFGPQSSPMTEVFNISTFLMNGQKMSIKPRWKLTKDGWWIMQLTDKVTLTKRNLSTSFFDQMLT